MEVRYRDMQWDSLTSRATKFDFFAARKVLVHLSNSLENSSLSLRREKKEVYFKKVSKGSEWEQSQTTMFVFFIE